MIRCTLVEMLSTRRIASHFIAQKSIVPCLGTASVRFFASGRFYTKSHEWISVEDGNPVGTVGLSDHAQGELGDLVFVDLPEVGSEVEAEGPLAAVESVKTAAEVYAPVSGEVVEVNEEVSSTPELVNSSPYDDGWIAKIKMNNPDDVEKLMDESAYKTYVESESH